MTVCAGADVVTVVAEVVVSVVLLVVVTVLVLMSVAAFSVRPMAMSVPGTLVSPCIPYLASPTPNGPDAPATTNIFELPDESLPIVG